MNADHLRLVSAAFLLSLGTATAAPKDAAPHILELTNGDRLHGALQSLDPAGEVILLHKEAPVPLRFKTSAFRRCLSAPSQRVESSSDSAVLTLRGGQNTPASVKSFDGQHLAVDSTWGGSFSIPWEQVEGLKFTGKPGSTLFSGPDSSQEWLFNNREDRDEKGKKEAENGEQKAEPEGERGWRIRDNSLVSDWGGASAVDADLPDRVEVEFDVSWETKLSMNFGLFADSFVTSDPEKEDAPIVFEKEHVAGRNIPQNEGLTFTLSARSVSIQLKRKDGSRDSIGHILLKNPLHERNHAHILIRADRQKGLLGVWIDGVLLEKWSQLGPFPGNGRALTFWRHQNGGEIEIQHLLARAWDGLFFDDHPSPVKHKDILLLRDSTRISGKLLRLEGDAWIVKTKLGEMEVSTEKLTQLVTAKSETTPPEDEFLLALEGSHFLHLNEARIHNEHITGTHTVLGKFDMDLKKMQKLERRDKSVDKEKGDAPW